MEDEGFLLLKINVNYEREWERGREGERNRRGVEGRER